MSLGSIAPPPNNLCFRRKLVVTNDLVCLLYENIVGHLASSLRTIHLVHFGSRTTCYSRCPFLECLDQPLARKPLLSQHAQEYLCFPQRRHTPFASRAAMLLFARLDSCIGLLLVAI